MIWFLGPLGLEAQGTSGFRGLRERGYKSGWPAQIPIEDLLAKPPEPSSRAQRQYAALFADLIVPSAR